MLTRVTITGADDDVDPNALRALADEFPFVEWGILFSFKRQGEPRYPSAGWVERLHPMWSHLSLHLCGEAARRARDGSAVGLELYEQGGGFSRIQVNGYAPPSVGLVHLANHWTSFRWILQVRDEASLQEAAKDAAKIHGRRGSLLFDPSGGRGERTVTWPYPPENTSMGYAGGISPENIESVLLEIRGSRRRNRLAYDLRLRPFWIDMESGVRTDDRFDLAKVRAVLEACAPFVRPEAR